MAFPQKIVLLVDDGLNEQLLFEVAGKKAGVSYGLRHVPDGPGAIDYLEGRGAYSDREVHPLPALVVLDVNMPGLTGFDVLEWIRRHPVFRSLPVVMWTSSSEDSDIARAHALLVNSYLVKPLSLLALVGIVRMLDEYWLKLNHGPRLERPGTAAPVV